MMRALPQYGPMAGGPMGAYGSGMYGMGPLDCFPAEPMPMPHCGTPYSPYPGDMVDCFTCCDFGYPGAMYGDMPYGHPGPGYGSPYGHPGMMRGNMDPYQAIAGYPPMGSMAGMPRMMNLSPYGDRSGDPTSWNFRNDLGNPASGIFANPEMMGLV